MKVYIVEAWQHDFECSWSEIVKIFEDKEDAELFALQCEEDCKKCTQTMKEFDEETYRLSEPYTSKIRKGKLLPKELIEYQKIMKERYDLKQKLKSNWIENDKYWYDGNMVDFPSFEISKYEVVGKQNEEKENKNKE